MERKGNTKVLIDPWGASKIRFIHEKNATAVYAILLGLAYFLFAVSGLRHSGFVEDDEAREVGIVQDIVQGNWLWPRFNDSLIPDKPILYHWGASLPVLAFGFSEQTVRLSSALAASLTIIVVVLVGARLYSTGVGVCSGVILFSMMSFFSRARVARPDTLLVFTLFIALVFALRWWEQGRSRDAFFSLSALGIAVLVKGPVAPALYAATLGLFALWERDLKRPFKLLCHPALLVFVLLGASWYVVTWLGWGSEFVDQHLLGRYLRNVVGEHGIEKSFAKRGWFWHLTFYPLHLLLVALPWTPLLLGALYQQWKTNRLADHRVRFFCCWAVAPILVFTAAEWKLRYYLLPSLPALALIGAPLLYQLWRDRGTNTKTARNSRAWKVGVLCGTGFVLAIGLIVVLYPGLLSKSDRLNLVSLKASLGGSGLILFCFGAVLCLCFAGLVAWKRWAALHVVLFGVTLFWMVLGAPALEQRISERGSFEAFAGAITANFSRDEAVSFFRKLAVNAIVVYAERTISALNFDEDLLQSGQGLIVDQAGYEKLFKAGRVGPILAGSSGRTENLGHGLLILTRVR